MQQPGRVLIVDDNEDVLFAAEMLLGEHVSQVRTETRPQRLPELLAEERFDLVLLDMNFTQDVTSGQEGLLWLDRVLELDATISVVMITAYADIELAVQAIKQGACDFIVKPWQNEKLLATAFAALSLSHSRREAQTLRSRQQQLSADLDQPHQDFVGNAPLIRQVQEVVGKVAITDANVLITGEHGTGKELVARAVHRRSHRASEVFVSVDIAALSDTLFESELFGHVKGAFTDARESRPGRFELASGGTLLLDEIGNLSLSLQAKLLTVLQSRKVTPLGSASAHEVDIRLICATNVSLPDKVAQGKFREDLLYRINTIEIPLPPLRQRLEDISVLAHHFLTRYSSKYQRQITGIGSATLNKLRAYHWPGNVRELQHAIERAVIMSSSTSLQPGDFSFADSASDGGSSMPLDTFNLEEIEAVVIRNALSHFGGNISRAARELGISRPSLYRKLARYGL